VQLLLYSPYQPRPPHYLQHKLLHYPHHSPISQLLFTIPNTNIFISHSILALNNNLFSNIPNFTKINPNIKTLITKSEKNTIPTFRYQWPASRSQVSTSVFESRLQFLHHFAKNPPPVRLRCVTFP